MLKNIKVGDCVEFGSGAISTDITEIVDMKIIFFEGGHMMYRTSDGKAFIPQGTDDQIKKMSIVSVKEKE